MRTRNVNILAWGLGLIVGGIVLYAGLAGFGFFDGSWAPSRASANKNPIDEVYHLVVAQQLPPGPGPNTTRIVSASGTYVLGATAPNTFSVSREGSPRLGVVMQKLGDVWNSTSVTGFETTLNRDSGRARILDPQKLQDFINTAINAALACSHRKNMC